MISDREHEAALAALSDGLVQKCFDHAKDEDRWLRGDYGEIAARVGLTAAQIAEVRRSVTLEMLLLIGMLRRIKVHRQELAPRLP